MAKKPKTFRSKTKRITLKKQISKIKTTDYDKRLKILEKHFYRYVSRDRIETLERNFDDMDVRMFSRVKDLNERMDTVEKQNNEKFCHVADAIEILHNKELRTQNETKKFSEHYKKKYKKEATSGLLILERFLKN